MQETSIPSHILQPFLDSAANAAIKDQSKFFTPLKFGKQLAVPLPEVRPVICDLGCGNGSLLLAAANESTELLLGCDIDPCPLGSAPGCTHRKKKIAGDVTRLFELYVEVDWRADLFVLNPGWNLHWYRDRLQALADSDVDAVRAAFNTRDPRLSTDTIDSTVATLMMSLDRCTRRGEGLLIANNATLERLIFATGAPHAALAEHVWARLVIPGNPMTGIADHAFSKDGRFETGVIYFARGHENGPQSVIRGQPEMMGSNRLEWRNGPEVTSDWQRFEFTGDRWDAVADEWSRRQRPDKPMPFHLWLSHDGTIHTGLSLFEQQSVKVDKNHAARLHKLNGKTPMQLVLQRAERDELLKLCNLPVGQNRPKGWGEATDEPPFWRVDPKLQDEVRAAVTAYHACRAPLYPLPPMQRLGYLDEEEFITCRKDLGLRYRSGTSYRVSSKTVKVRRMGQRPNLEGDMEDIEYSGQELALFIEDEEGLNLCFMEARLREPGITLDFDDAKERAHPIDFTLQELAEHFDIPDVPDIAALKPEEYAAQVEKLAQLERDLN